MTYEKDSDVQVTYGTNYEPSFNRYHVNFVNKSNDYFALFVSSNCQPEVKFREDYVLALMKYGIKVVSLGKCLKNAESKNLFPDCHSGPDDTRGNKRCLVSKFKFYLAFENSRFDDYVTEKLLDIYDTGTIPVYLGAPNVKSLVPGNHSTIFVDDFKSPKELADYLQLVGNNENLYNEYFAWKYMRINPNFEDLQRHDPDHMRCNVCEEYSREWKIRYENSTHHK